MTEETARRSFRPLSWILPILLLLPLAWPYLPWLERMLGTGTKEPWIIAVAGPQSGKDQAKGEAMVNGARILIDQINARGGLDGTPLQLEIHDDLGQPDTARQVAETIGTSSRALAVLGHRTSGTSLAAGPVYARIGLPALTGTATARDITWDNPWFFRVIFDNPTQARFIAQYAHQVLGLDSVTMVHDQDQYSQNLVGAFAEEAERLGLTTTPSIVLDAKSLDSPEALAKAAQRLLKARPQPAFVLLVARTDSAATLVKQLRDADFQAPIFGADNLGQSDFAERFKEFEPERFNPGHYTRNLYVTTPWIRDVANETAQQFRQAILERHHREPDGAEAAYYDAAAMVASAIERAAIKGLPLKVARERVRDALAAVDAVDKAHKGATGLIYFDAHRNAPKPVPIGKFLQRRLVSAPTQFSQISNPRAIPDLEAQLARKSILASGTGYLQRTQMVYTGVAFERIDKIDPATATFEASFWLWFRHDGTFAASEIDFQNAVEPITLGQPFREFQNQEFHYRLYQVKGKFRFDIRPGDAIKNRHRLHVSFRHRTLDRQSMIYVVDFIGMDGLPGGDTPPKLFKADAGWSLDERRFFQHIVLDPILGDPRYLDDRQTRAGRSTFVTELEVVPNQLSLRRTLTADGAFNLLIVATLLLAAVLLPGRERMEGRLGPGRWFVIRGVLAGFYLFALENQLVQLFEGTLRTHFLGLLIGLFDAAWWLLPSVLLDQAARRFFFLRLEERTQRRIPKLVRGGTSVVVYAVALLGIMAFVLDLKLTSLMATSGLVAMIIGLAVQANIANIFSGLIINLERPFGIGDWVKIAENPPSKVIDMTWRTTRIRNSLGHIISVPNSKAAESHVHNFSAQGASWIQIEAETDPVHDPEQVIALLALSIDSLVGQGVPQPGVVRFMGIRTRGMVESAAYSIKFCMDDLGRQSEMIDRFWRRAWQELTAAGVRFGPLSRPDPLQLSLRPDEPLS